MAVRLVVFVLLCQAPALAAPPRLLAAALSAVVPGAGEAVLGWRTSAHAFLVAESGVWGARFYMGRRAAGYEDAYVRYAALHAGSDPRYRDRQYYDDMTRYWNSQRANQHYQDPQRYTGTRVWSWQTAEEWRQFKSLVRERRRWDEASKNVLALAVATRVASVVHCLKGRPGRLQVSPEEVSVSLAW